MLLWATPILSYRSSDWVISQKGRVCHNVNHWNRLQWRQSENCCCCRGALRHTSARLFGDVRGSPASSPPERVSTRLISWLVRDLTAALRHAAVLWYLCVIITVCQGCCAGRALQLRVSMCVWLPRSADPLRCDAKAQKRTQTPRCVHVRDWVCLL